MSKCHKVYKGDIIFCLFDVPETPRTVGLSNYDGMITGAYTVFKCSTPLLAQYFELFYLAMDDRKLLSPLYSGLRNTIPSERFVAIKTPIPPAEEQAGIVRFLDWATRKIERAIRAKRKLIALLNEQKQVIIHQAVTRGLNPAVPLKPSGIPWLGDIPTHWEVERLKSVADFWVSNVDKIPNSMEVPVLLCNYTDVYYHDFISSDMELMKSTATHAEIQKFHLQVGDVVITKDSEIWNDIAVPALVVKTVPNMVCGYHLAMVRPYSDKLCGKYLLRVLQSKKLAYQFYIASTGVIRHSLPKRAIGGAIIPFPSLEEQELICSYLDEKLSRIEKITTETRIAIKHMEEYRTRLVADVVTGQVDVRGVQLPAEVEEPLPEEPEAEEELDELLEAEVL